MASERLRKFRLERAAEFTARLRTPVAPETPSPSTLPAIAARADDLESIKKAVEDAASVGAPLWLSYLFLLFYIAIAAGGVKHADLLLENPVELPFLNIKLPLKAFFVLAPILFVIVHAYVMAHFALLADKAKLFHIELKRQFDGAPERSHGVREGLRKQLPVNMFVQFLAGPADIREGPFSVLLWAIAWISLVGGPLAVLLLLQVQFLPYHDSRVTLIQRGALLADLVIHWTLWMQILSGRGRADGEALAAPSRWPRLWSAILGFWTGFLWLSRNIIAWPVTIGLALFSVLVATFPGEWRQWPYSLVPALEPWATPATERIFGKVDPLNEDEKARITGSWPLNTLRLKEFDIYEALKVEERAKFDEKRHSYILHDRHLESADLRSARLGKVDLRGAHLQGAWLDGAQISGATLDGAELRGASLDGAGLQGASLDEAQLQGATLRLAQLQGASLYVAQLQGAALDHAGLQGASLEGALPQGASLSGAQLQGASLDRAEIQGASLEEAEIQGASLFDTAIEAVDLMGAFLWRAISPPTPAASMTLGLQWGAVAGFDPWTAARYTELRITILRDVPEGERRTMALKRIETLDCARKDHAPCDPKAKPPPIAAEFSKANVSRAEYNAALAKILRGLVCGGRENASYILRGIMGARFNALGRLAAAGGEAPALIDDIIRGNNCPVSAALTGADKARLLEIKKGVAAAQEQPAKAEPAPAPSRTAPPPSPPGRPKIGEFTRHNLLHSLHAQDSRLSLRHRSVSGRRRLSRLVSLASRLSDLGRNLRDRYSQR